MSKQKNKPFRTPQGVAQYPWLNKADFQFDSAGQFKVGLRVKPDEAKELMAAAQEAANDAFGADGKSARMPFKTDNETGEVIITAKSKYKPKFVDSSGALIGQDNEPAIYGGSTLKLAGSMYPYNAGGQKGISLQLAGVQIIELSQGNAGSFSFDAVDGGFVAANDNAEAAGGEYNF